jgi:2-dehydro-3-deoxyphosphogluconate aldolase/(4S)-4-hydroxy-2-oxoglutarate aldolase
MSRSLNTSEPKAGLIEAGLIEALHHQPLLVVLRAFDPLELAESLERLQDLRVHQVEVAWSAHPQWVPHCALLRQRFPRLHLGAASVLDGAGLEAAATAGLAYVVSPVLDRQLVDRARRLRLPLVPGVLSPTEVHQARLWGCSLVKLFPAISVGKAYWQRLTGPLGGERGLPHCIAAGGLRPADVEPWLEAGVDAVALGGALANDSEWEALAALVARLGGRTR